MRHLFASDPFQWVGRSWLRTPLLVLVLVTRNAGFAAQWGAVARRGGLTGWSKVSQASTRRNTLPPAQFAPARATGNAVPAHHHKQIWHQITLAGRGKGRSTASGLWRPRTLCLSAPFAKPQLAVEPPRTALSSQHYLMLPRRAFTLIRLPQKRRNYLYKMPAKCLWHMAWTGHTVQNICSRVCARAPPARAFASKSRPTWPTPPAVWVVSCSNGQGLQGWLGAAGTAKAGRTLR